MTNELVKLSNIWYNISGNHPISYYIIFSLYTLLFTIFALDIIGLPIYPNINRVVYFDKTVEWTLTGFSQYDIAIASSLYLVGVLLFFEKHLLVPLSLYAVITIVIAIIYPAGNQLANFLFLVGPMLLILLPLGLRRLSGRNRIINERLNITHHSFRVRQFLAVLFTIIAGLELIVLLHWTTSSLVSGPTSSWNFKLNSLESNFFYAFGLLSPTLLLLSLTTPLQRILISYLRSTLRLPSITINELSYVDTLPGRQNSLDPAFRLPAKIIFRIEGQFSRLLENEFRSILIACVAGIVPAILLAIYPYSLPNISQGPPLGVDIPSYLSMLEILKSSSGQDFVTHLFVTIDGGGRAIPLLFIYSIAILTDQSFESILNYLPTILGPILILTVYYLTRVAYPHSRQIAVIAAIMTAISHQMIIGFYAAFYANWIALVFIYVASIFLLRSFQEPNHKSRNAALFGTFTLVSIFSHSYTWSYFIAAVILFLAWSAIQDRKTRRNTMLIMILGSIIAGTIVIDFARSFVSGFTSIDKDLTLANSSVGLDQFSQRWQNLNATFRLHLGGYFTGSAVLLLLVIWALHAKYDSHSDRLILSMLFVAILPVLFGSYDIQARIFYNIPFQIPASIVMYRIYSSKNLYFGKPLFFAILLMQCEYAVRAMANMSLVLPN